MPTKLKKILESLWYLFVFLLPWQAAWIFGEKIIGGDKWQYGTMLLYATEILFWVLILFWLAAIVKEKNFLISNFKIYFLQKNKLAIVVGLWLFLIFSGLSIFWSPDKSLAFYFWFKLLEAAVLFGLVLSNDLSPKKTYWSLTAAGVVQAILAMAQFFSQAIVANKWLGMAGHWPGDLGAAVVGVGDSRWLRAYGSLAHPNFLGGFLALTLAAAVLLAWDSWQKDKKIFWPSLALTIISAGMFFTFSRTAWLAAAAVLLIFLFLNFNPNDFRKKMKFFVGALMSAVVVIIILSVIFWPLVSTRVSLNHRLEAKSINQRIGALAESQKIISQHWLGGAGLGSYGLVWQKNNPDLPIYEYQPVHNLFLLIWVEAGIIGLLFFLIHLSAIIFFLYQRQNIGLVLIFALIVLSLFDHYFWTQYTGVMLWWLILAISLKTNKNYA
jgi:O-antigen ligase